MLQVEKVVEQALVSGNMVGKDGHVYFAISKSLSKTNCRFVNMSFAELSIACKADETTCRKAVSRLSTKGYLQTEKIDSAGKYRFKLASLSPCGLPIAEGNLRRWQILLEQIPRKRKLTKDLEFMKNLDAYFRLGGIKLAKQYTATFVIDGKVEASAKMEAKRKENFYRKYDLEKLISKNIVKSNSPNLWKLSAYNHVKALQKAGGSIGEIASIMNKFKIKCDYDNGIWTVANLKILLSEKEVTKSLKI